MVLKWITDTVGIRRGTYRMIRGTLLAAGGLAWGWYAVTGGDLIVTQIVGEQMARLVYASVGVSGLDWVLDEYTDY